VRAQILVVGLLQAALLMACDRNLTRGEPDRVRQNVEADAKSASPVPLGIVGGRPASPAEQPAAGAEDESWFHISDTDPGSRLIVRTGQAGIEVDSLEPAMAELRRVVQRIGGFVADASVQSGRNQVRSATLQIKVPAMRFDDLTEGLGPIGKLQFVNVAAEDVSEEFVDLTARVANARRLEQRLIDLLRTRTGKLQDVLSVEHELARIREEIERMEGRMRFLRASAQLSTLSVNLYEPPPLVASVPGRSPIAEAFRTAWRNFVGLLAGVIASLGFVVPVAMVGWAAVVLGRRIVRKVA
jgi:Domain of unknown function (DUF4349)